MNKTVEKMNGCEYSIQTIIVPLQKCIAGTKFFSEIIILLLQELISELQSFCDKKDTPLQGTDDCN